MQRLFSAQLAAPTSRAASARVSAGRLSPQATTNRSAIHAFTSSTLSRGWFPRADCVWGPELVPFAHLSTLGPVVIPRFAAAEQSKGRVRLPDGSTDGQSKR